MRKWIGVTVGVVILAFVGLGVLTYATWGRWFNVTFVTGSGKVVKQTRAISGVRQLEVDGSMEVFVAQGNAESLQVEAEDNLLPYLTSEVTDGRLTLSTKPGASIRGTKPVRFYLTVKDLSEVKLTGSGSIQCAGLRTARLGVYLTGSGDITCTSATQDLASTCTGSGQVVLISETGQAHLQVTGSGGIDGKIRAQSVESSITGSGTISLAGMTDTQQVSIMGSGDYRGAALQSKVTRVRIGGSGNAAVDVSERLEATITGSGDITYAGAPSVSQHITGSGEVRHAG